MGIFESIITILLLFFGLGAFLFAGVFGTVSSMLQHSIDKISDINQGVLIITAIVAIIAQVFVVRELGKYMKGLEKNQ